MSREPTNVNYLLFTQQTFVNKSNDPMVGKNPIGAIPLIQWKIVDRIKLKEEIKNRSKKKKKRERLRDSAAVLEFALNLESVLGVGGRPWLRERNPKQLCKFIRRGNKKGIRSYISNNNNKLMLTLQRKINRNINFKKMEITSCNLTTLGCLRSFKVAISLLIWQN